MTSTLLTAPDSTPRPAVRPAGRPLRPTRRRAVRVVGLTIAALLLLAA